MPKQTPFFDDFQATRHADAQQANREAAIRQALSAIDPHNDDAKQAYLEVVRRLRDALGRELTRNVSPSA